MRACRCAQRTPRVPSRIAVALVAPVKNSGDACFCVGLINSERRAKQVVKGSNRPGYLLRLRRKDAVANVTVVECAHLKHPRLDGASDASSDNYREGGGGWKRDTRAVDVRRSEARGEGIGHAKLSIPSWLRQRARAINCV